MSTLFKSIHILCKSTLRGSLFFLILHQILAQVPDYFPPFLPQLSPQEKEAQYLIHSASKDLAKFRPHSFHPFTGDTSKYLVQNWLKKHSIQYDSVNSIIYPEPWQKPFVNLIPELWADKDEDDMPDIADKSEAWFIQKAFAGNLTLEGLYIEKTGILIRADSILLPRAFGLKGALVFKADSGNALNLVMKTSAGMRIEEYQVRDSLVNIFEFQMPLQDSMGNSWCSFSILSASVPNARILLKDFSLRIAEADEFILYPEDTVRLTAFSVLNYRPEFMRADGKQELQGKLISAPGWVNLDEKGFIYGRATCPEGVYPVEIQYGNHPDLYKNFKFNLSVKLPAKKELEKPLPVAVLNALMDQAVSMDTIKGATQTFKKEVKKKRPHIAGKQAPLPVAPLWITQASLIHESSPAQHIRYLLNKDGYVSLYILNKSGDPVKTILQYQKYMPGKYNILWDGSNDAGESLAGGEYECRMDFLPADGSPPHTEHCIVLKVF